MTMSTYKSLGGPPSGLLVTNDASIAERVDAIAYPGLTANFDSAKTAALAITLLDWKDLGGAYAKEMLDTASALANHLTDAGVAVHGGSDPTRSHAFALDARPFGDGHACARHLREANLLASGIGLPVESEPGTMPGLRIGTNEIVRWGMTAGDMEELATLIAAALRDPQGTAEHVSEFRSRFTDIHFVRDAPETR
jgi:glycine hydroxymethyltransferase